MEKKTKLKKILIIVLALIVIVAGFLFFFYSRDKSGNTVADNAFGWQFPVAKFPVTGSGDQLAYSDIRDPGGIAQGLPVRLQIPVIGVDSAIEDALITPDGKMDVPAGSVNVAWFALGPHPGEVGSAVIGGHFGISNGVPFVFYNLDKLKIGDKIYVLNDKGDTLAFIVHSISSFNRNADATTVFTSNDGLAHLNLITCEGIWNQVNGNYPQRLVVFADAIPAEGAAPASITYHRTLSLGMHGTDVVALQNALIQKKFLTMSPKVAKGYFGTLTRAAVTKYQKSLGLAANGVFGSSTIAKLVAEPSLAVLKPALPSTAIMPSSTPTSQTLIQSVESLYATPVSGLITSLLLLAIVFLIFRISRR